MPNKKERNKVKMMKVAVCAAAFVGAFVALPNTSPTIAYAMEKIPGLGQLVRVVTFRDYEYEDEQHRADVEIPELVVETEPQEAQPEEILENTTDEINAEIQLARKAQN